MGLIRNGKAACVILHVDMDAFFASVEQRDHPEWRGKPVIVGAEPHARGVVSTCSYEARRFGVHSAMPSRTAYARCPHGIFVAPRMARYEEVSAAAFDVFSRYSPFVEPVSVDEAFLDITGTEHLFGGALPLGESLRAAVREACGVTCSVGLAPNRLLAKIASEERKPDGLFRTPSDPAEICAYLAPKPVSALWGAGKKTTAELERYGYRTCGDLQRADIRFLERILGPAAAVSLVEHARGIDRSAVAFETVAEKSVSREHTFGEDTSDRAEVRAALLELVDDVGRRFRSERRWARTAKLKLRTADFETSTRQARFETASRDGMAFQRQALRLFDAMWTGTPVRLVGFGVTDIVDRPDAGEDTLFGPDPRTARREKRERLSEVLDALAPLGLTRL